MAVITLENFEETLAGFKQGCFGFDLETTGLNPYTGAKIFSAIVSNRNEDFYFNFNGDADHLGNKAPANTILPTNYLEKIIGALDRYNVSLFIHNAKFDLRFLKVVGLNFNHAKIFCTEMLARLINNRLPNYKLSSLGELVGHFKDDEVEKYITKNKLYTLVDVGKKRPRKVGKAT